MTEKYSPNFFPSKQDLDISLNHYQSKMKPFDDNNVNDIEILNIASEKDLKAIFKRSYPKIIMSTQKYFDTDNPSIKNIRQIIINKDDLFNIFTTSLEYEYLKNKYINKKQIEIENKPAKNLGNRLVNKAHKSFNGCILNKVVERNPEIIYECQNDSLINDYSKHSLDRNDIKNNLYQKAIQTGYNDVAQYIVPSQPKHELSFLNKSLKSYIVNNPQKFDNYVKEISAETSYLKSIKKSIKDERYKDNSRVTKRGRVNSASTTLSDVLTTDNYFEDF